MKKLNNLLIYLDIFAHQGYLNYVAPKEMEDEEYNKNVEKLRRPGHCCGGICSILLAVFLLYSVAEFSKKIAERESLFSEKLYIANKNDKKIKYDT